MVTLFHIHGSTILFEQYDVESPVRTGVLYVGPKQWSPGTGLLAIMGVQPGESLGEEMGPHFTEDNEDRVAKGWIFLRGHWFRPIFVPPSRHKPQYANGYCAEIRRRIHSFLPDTQRLVFAGYSFPAADTEYLNQIFVNRILHSKLEIEVVNRENSDPAFRSRVSATIPCTQPIYSFDDFREFCKSMAAD